MCSSQTQQFISQVVSNKMSSDVMFTLYDITLEVKKLENAAGLKASYHHKIHDDVAAEVRQQIVPAGWQRQLQPMGSGGLTAFVHYNPNTHDPATYTPLDRKDAPAASGVHPSAIAFAAKVPDDDDDDDDTNQTTPVDGKAPDRWGRLRLLSDVMRQAGFAPGDLVFVRAIGNMLEVSKNGKDGPRYIVDQYTNIRLTPRTLQSANLDGKTSYKITASSGVICII
jgi:hypothetical protein